MDFNKCIVCELVKISLFCDYNKKTGLIGFSQIVNWEYSFIKLRITFQSTLLLTNCKNSCKSFYKQIDLPSQLKV